MLLLPGPHHHVAGLLREGGDRDAAPDPHAELRRPLGKQRPDLFQAGQHAFHGRAGQPEPQRAEAYGRHVESAALLGAASRLRGAPDRTDQQVVELTRRDRAALGDEASPRRTQRVRSWTEERP
ncbi:hypothetical protein [Actinoplanes sp. NBRC 103695]|uniref:hypothetical protein n=1 Tax=Actinoplanes sp. NBRC 103695 TaxID=3032202 RepID=UPI002553C25E|nr:hypothetical protein [Actinoplanes sp. NBRC 103695]